MRRKLNRDEVEKLLWDLRIPRNANGTRWQQYNFAKKVLLDDCDDPQQRDELVKILTEYMGI